MVAMANQKAAPSENPEQPHGDQVKEPPAEYVHARNLQVAYGKAWLADEDDVDRYLSSLREVLLNEINKGRKVQI